MAGILTSELIVVPAAYPDPPSNLFPTSAQSLGFTRINLQQVGTYDGKWQVKDTTKLRNKPRDSPGPYYSFTL
jgi:hypothetical protein